MIYYLNFSVRIKETYNKTKIMIKYFKYKKVKYIYLSKNLHRLYLNSRMS